MKQAAVIGAGTMGNGIAHVFAQHGLVRSTLIDTRAGRAGEGDARRSRRTSSGR